MKIIREWFCVWGNEGEIAPIMIVRYMLHFYALLMCWDFSCWVREWMRKVGGACATHRRRRLNFQPFLFISECGTTTADDDVWALSISFSFIIQHSSSTIVQKTMEGGMRIIRGGREKKVYTLIISLLLSLLKQLNEASHHIMLSFNLGPGRPTRIRELAAILRAPWWTFSFLHACLSAAGKDM